MKRYLAIALAVALAGTATAQEEGLLSIEVAIDGAPAPKQVNWLLPGMASALALRGRL